MHRQRTTGGCTVLAVGLLASLFILSLFTSPVMAQEKSAAMTQFESLGKAFDQLQKAGVQTLGPQELADECDDLIDDAKDLVKSASSDPNTKARTQDLLHKIYSFAGMQPESRATFSDYLDTLEAWQGKDYAAMAVQCTGDRILQRKRDPARAVMYYDLQVQKYPNHPTKPHALYHSGLACIEAKCYGEAIGRLDAAVAADPQGEYAPWALRRKAHALFLGRSEEESEKVEESLKVLDELAEKYPTPHWQGYVQHRKGVTLASEKRYLEAIAEYTKGIEAHPSSAYSWMSTKHVAQIREKMETEMLDELVQKQRLDEQEQVQKDTTSPPTAEIKPPKAPDTVSMLTPHDENLIGEGVTR